MMLKRISTYLDQETFTRFIARAKLEKICIKEGTQDYIEVDKLLDILIKSFAEGDYIIQSLFQKRHPQKAAKPRAYPPSEPATAPVEGGQIV
jgi:hypothetical protein